MKVEIFLQILTLTIHTFCVCVFVCFNLNKVLNNIIAKLLFNCIKTKPSLVFIVLQEQQNSWSCFECHQNFPTSEDLQKHLNQHDGEDRNGPKTRSKSKTKSKKNQFNRLRVSICLIFHLFDYILVQGVLINIYPEYK